MAVKTSLNAEINDMKGEIPDIINLAANAPLSPNLGAGGDEGSNFTPLVGFPLITQKR